MADRSVTVRLRADISDFKRGMASASASSSGLTRDVERSGKQIDRLSGRLSLLAQAASVAGPALLPLGAGAIPGVIGLTAELGSAAGALGVMLAAVHGVGDGLKALNAYQLEPTAENLAKVREEFGKLGPEGVHFVQFLDRTIDQLSGLQQLARAGWFPGLEDGITSALDLMPRLRDIVKSLASTMGDLSADAGANLAGPKFTAFFDYLEHDAAPTLDTFARTVGNFAVGLANMLAAFAPVSRGFTSGLEDMSSAFAEWSQHLDTDQGFQAFVDYLQTSGPKALDFIESLVGALVGIAKAAAPVGDVVLPILTKMLDLIGDLADSPIGSAFFTAAAAMSVYSRAMAVGVAAQTRYAGSLSRTVSGLFEVTSAQERAQTVAGRLTASQASSRLAFAKTAGAMAGLAFVSSGAADKMGLTNTATLALVGSMTPLGIAGGVLGGAVGLMLDWRDSQTKAVEETKRNTAALQQFMDAADLSKLKALADQANQLAVRPEITGDQGEALARQLAAEANGFMQVKDALNEYRAATTGADPTGNMTRLSAAAGRLQPLLQQQGMTLSQLATMPGPFRQVFVDAMVASAHAADSARGRVASVRDAIAGLGDVAVSTEDKANSLGQALDNLLSPQMDLSAATDAWTTALRHLSDDLDKNSRTLHGNSDAAIKNRAAIRDRVTALTDVLGAQAAAGAGSAKLSRTLKTERAALLDAGQAAGISRKDMEAYLHTLGLTPKLVRTLIQANVAGAQSAVSRFKQELDSIDRNIDIYFRAHTTRLPSVSGMGPQIRPADGTTVPGPRYPYGDKIHALLAPGEEVISNRFGQADRHRSLLKAINANRMAAGGTVGGSYSRLYTADDAAAAMSRATRDLADVVRDQARSLKAELAARQKQLSAEQDAAKQRLDQLRQERAAFAQTVTSLYRTDIFGQSQDFTDSPLSASAQAAMRVTAQRNVLTSDIANGREALRLYKQLRAKGLDGPAFRALVAAGDVETLRAYASMSKAELGSYERLYERRQHLSARVGAYAGNVEYGKAIDRQSEHLKQTNVELKGVNRRLDRLEHAAHAEGAKATGKAVADAIDHSTDKARRRAPSGGRR